jgi:ParB family chromosome partitioning protein
MAKKTSLNKGLQALLGEVDPVSAAPKEPAKTTKTTKIKNNTPTSEISVSSIKANQYQPRTSFDEKKLKELSESIKKHGVIQPILLRQEGKGYELIAGERRLRASKLAGLKKIPAVVAKISNLQSLEIAILENVQREDLNPLEVSKGYQRLKEEFGYTQEQVAKSVGKPRSSIANSLRLLSLPEKAQVELEKGAISEGHAKVLLGVDPAKIENLLERILKEELSVRALESSLDNTNHNQTKKKEKSRDELNLESALSSKLGSKVTIDDTKGKGKMTIKYYSYDELDGIIEKISS